MGSPLGTSAAVNDLAKLLDAHHKSITKSAGKSPKRSKKNSIGPSKLGGRKGQYVLLQDMYIAIMKIPKLAKGPQDDSIDHDMCNLILRIVRKGFRASKFNDGVDQRQRIHKYSAILRLAWMKRIDKEILVRDIFYSGGIEKFAARWRKFNNDQINDD